MVNGISDNTVVKTDGNNYWLEVGGDSNKYDAGTDINLGKDVQQIVNNLGGLNVTVNGQKLEDILKSIGNADKVTFANGDDEQKKGAKILGQLGKVLKNLEELKNAMAQANDPGEKEFYEKLEKALLAEAKQLLDQAKAQKADTNANKTIFDTQNQRYNNLTQSNTTTPKPKGGAPSGPNGDNGPDSQGNAKAAGGWGPQDGGFQFAWSAGPKGGGFDFNAYANSVYGDQAILEGWDSIGKNQGEQRKMMMLFMYFAKMAMSGDMGAMYRFMQFITYIISKDKALQNVHMASKLIELENSSRAALQELLDTPAPANGDQEASTNFTKVMEETKATQSTVATSQKLLAQMMEEMAQVLESLVSMTKLTLDTQGRILRKVSGMGG